MFAVLAATFKGEFEYRPDLLDYRLATLDGLMSLINIKLVNRRWYKFQQRDYVTSFGVMEWGRYGVNPHYHILLDVPNTQKQTYEALNKIVNNPKFVLRFESFILPSDLNQINLRAIF
ncbi:MAG: hypothetical protein COB24_04740 [Hyphomicrobiales bacterium]|nr:MAG: hypothetical protein COB24_04740 [Hyphomicrobiales bacterium]